MVVVGDRIVVTCRQQGLGRLADEGFVRFQIKRDANGRTPCGSELLLRIAFLR